MTETAANWVLPKESASPVFLDSPFECRCLTLDLNVLSVSPITDLAVATAPPTAQAQSSLSQRYKIAAASPHTLTVTKTAAKWVLPKDSVNPVILRSPLGCRYLALDLTTKDTTTPVIPESLEGASPFSRELYGISAATPCVMRIFHFPAFSFPAPARSSFKLFLQESFTPVNIK